MILQQISIFIAQQQPGSKYIRYTYIKYSKTTLVIFSDHTEYVGKANFYHRLKKVLFHKNKKNTAVLFLLKKRS